MAIVKQSTKDIMTVARPEHQFEIFTSPRKDSRGDFETCSVHTLESV
jgi:hypothetical protein